MFESFVALPLHFTIEFLGFLVTAGGAFLVMTRPALVPGRTSNRATVSFGFAALAVALVLHGGSFVENDGDRVLLALRGLGLVAVLIGVAGGLRGGVGVPAAFALREPFAFAPAGAAFLLSAIALARWSESGARALKRLALAAFLLGASEVFVAISPVGRFGTRLVDVYGYAAHGVKLLGFIALGAWLWTGVRTSIRTRFVASFAALLVAVVLALSTALTGVISDNVEDEELKRVSAQVGNAIETIEEADTKQLLDDVQTIAGLPFVQESVAVGPSALGPLADDLPRSEPFTMDFAVMLDPRGRLLAAGGRGPATKTPRGRIRSSPLGDDDVLKILGSQVVLDIVDRGFARAASPDNIGSSVAIVAAADIPHPTIPSRVAAIVVIGRFVDALTMERISDSLAPARASLVVGGRVVASELPVEVAAEDLVPQSEVRALEIGETVAVQRTFGRHAYFTALAPLQSSGGIPLGTVALSSPARIVTSARQAVTQILFLVALGVGTVALGLAWLFGRRITRPIQLLTQMASEVREGNLQARAQVEGEDEVGQLGETFNEMTESLLTMTSELRTAAREEQQLRARIETIIQSMADGLVAVDSDRRILAFNKEAEHLTGVKARSALGKAVDKVLQVQEPGGEAATLPIFELAAGSVAGIMLVQRSGGRIPIAATSAVLRTNEGEIAGGVAVLRDMTREREIERMKSEFLSNISHELRTPLTPIKGYAEILTRKDLPPEKTKQFATGILESTARLERIVELLVDFAAMEGGRLAPRAAPVDIGALVQQVGREWKARAKGHKLVMDVKTRLPKVAGDERLLKRSLEEVLDNAVKFSEGGTIRLEARAASQSQNGQARRRMVRVSVSDEGRGIPPEDIHKIFSDFQQLDGSETRAFGGLGLGLTFVQRILDLHHGYVDVESELDKGTRLTLVLPAAAGRARKAVTRPD